MRERFIVLRRLPMGDSDDLLVCLGESLGLFSAAIRNSRATNSRLAGLVEPPNELEGVFYEGSRLGRLQNLVLSRGFAGLSARLESLLTAGFLVRLFRESLPEREPAVGSYQLLGVLLEALSRGEPVVTVALIGQDRLLVELGLGISWDECGACGSQDVRWYSPSIGGALCSECSAEKRWPMSLQTVAAVRALRGQELGETLPVLEPLPIREVGRILKAQFQYYLSLPNTVFRPVLAKRQV